MTTVPTEIMLATTRLRALQVSDADAMAGAVRVDLDHLRPWMAWADDTAGDPAFQRARLRGVTDRWATGEEFNYGLFAADDDETVLGAFSLLTRQGPGTLEIGYWLAQGMCGRGFATEAAAALTNVALKLRGIKQSLIYTDEANTRSAAIPRRLGYGLLRVEQLRPTAPAETGRMQVWLRTESIRPARR